MSRARVRALLAAAAVALLALASCGHDAAEREYYAALRGEEDGSTRREQVAHLDRAIDLMPRRARYWETRAIYRIDLRAFDAARSDLDRAIELAERPYLRFLRGLVICQQGHPADALTDFDAAIAGQPKNDQFYRGRALARVAVGSPEAALVDAELLVSRAPQDATSYYARGLARRALGKLDAALADFEEAIRRRPELVYPRTARADCLERLGDAAGSAAAREAAERAAAERAGCAVCLDPFRY